MSAQIQIASVAGREARYLEGGTRASADVLLLAHAFPVGPRLFEPQLDAWPGWRVIAPAMPGFEGSALLDPPSIDGYARFVAGLLDHLGVQRTVVGGVSMGGHFTYAMLRLAPERVRGIVLADTRSTADNEEALAGRRRMAQTIEERGAAGVAHEMVPRLLGSTTQTTRPAVVARVRQLIESQTPAAIAAANQVLMTRPDSTAMLAAVRVPALVVVGEEDSLSPPAEMKGIADQIPGAAFVQLPRTGHLANLEDPAAFNAAVSAWLQSVA